MSEFVPSRSDDAPLVLTGLAGSAGLAIGRAVVVGERRVSIVRRRIQRHVVDDEVERFVQGVARAVLDLREVAKKAGASLPKAELSILEAYILMLSDDGLKDDVERRIRVDHQCAEWAVEGASREMAEQLRRSGNAYLAERSHDFEFVGDLVQRALVRGCQPTSLPEITEPGVVVARDLSPAETAGLDKNKVLALVTEVGTRTSHTAILARALEIPAVVGVSGLLAEVASGDELVVDGYRGLVTRAPTQEIINVATLRAERHLALSRDLHAGRDAPSRTKCGVDIVIRANIELPSEAKIALYEGARGIGLYRTEFLYVDRTTSPSEDEQYEVYRAVVEQVAPDPVIVRTFDIGGDKFVSAFQAPPQMNPALGLRAVRLGLARPELFLEQLRAIVRASAHGSVQIMIPMLASVSELTAVRDLLNDAIEQVDAKGQPRAETIPLGAMIEVPAAAIMANEFAVIAEFMSIGTNDLIQYALAVDRTSRELAALASPFDPAILRLIRQVVEAGQNRARPVSVCGAMASDPLAVVLLLGMGIRQLSMEAGAIPGIREAIARVAVREAEAMVLETLEMATAGEILAAVAEAFAPRFADLLEPEA
jgi:phosphoenolpyruvate-protein phosphotransferase (PTS system enzyme I)